MSIDTVLEHATSDGVRTVLRKSDEDEGPRPIDDEELEAIAGGSSYRVTFQDGCTIDVTFHGGTGGMSEMDRAAQDAQEVHGLTGHQNEVTSVTSL